MLISPTKDIQYHQPLAMHVIKTKLKTQKKQADCTGQQEKLVKPPFSYHSCQFVQKRMLHYH